MTIITVDEVYVANLISVIETCHADLLDCMCDNITLGYPIEKDLADAKKLSNAIFFLNRVDLSITDEDVRVQKTKEEASEVCTINEFDLSDPSLVGPILYETNEVILTESGTEYIQREDS